MVEVHSRLDALVLLQRGDNVSFVRVSLTYHGTLKIILFEELQFLSRLKRLPLSQVDDDS